MNVVSGWVLGVGGAGREVPHERCRASESFGIVLHWLENGRGCQDHIVTQAELVEAFPCFAFYSTTTLQGHQNNVDCQLSSFVSR